jgi:hypothetical protein
VHTTGDRGVGRLSWTSAGFDHGCATVPQKGMTMKSTMALSTDNFFRTQRIEIGCRACDERLVTVAEADALRASVGTSPWPDAVSRSKK